VTKDQFCHLYQIGDEEFQRAGISWEKLEELVAEYSRIKPALESVGKYVVDALLKCSKVHSIKYRLKENDHLLEKVIRKRSADPQRRIDTDNFRTEITDLVGIRALHLFKEDWIEVHKYICSTWPLAEKPTAYVRAGDAPEVIQYYRDNNCEIKEHRFGYRSVHYLIESRPDRETYTVEIQARTVFEEAWGEIDHVISYPYHTENELLVRLSSILNRLAANADELGSYMRYLKRKTDLREREYQETIHNKNSLIEDLRARIESLEIDSDEKAALTSGLNELGKNRSAEAEFSEQFPWLDHFMESHLFQDIAKRINTIVNSEEFEKIELSESDIQLLSNAQRDLLHLVDNPQLMARMLREQPFRNSLRQIENGISLTEDEKEEGNDNPPEGNA